jgi:hypothetical protein
MNLRKVRWTEHVSWDGKQTVPYFFHAKEVESQKQPLLSNIRSQQ